MKRLIAILAILCAANVHAQTWTTVAAPTRAPFMTGAGSNVVWKHPFDAPCPPGEYEVSNVIVDRRQRMGVRSQPRKIVAQAGWSLYGDTSNQPISRDDVGIIWIVKCVNVQEGGLFKNGTEHLFTNNRQPLYTIAPYSGDAPYAQELVNTWQDYRPLSAIKTGGSNTIVAPAPQAYAVNFPWKPCEIATCRVTETGETALSPVLQFTPPEGYPAETKVGWVNLGTADDPHPQGTIGYHVYVRFAGGEWKRIPAPHCYGEPATPDDWLFQWWDCQPVLRRYLENAPTHQPVANPQSRLNEIQLKLKNEDGDINVREATLGVVTYDCYCPVIDEYGSGNVKAFRRIGTAKKQNWKLVQQTSQSGHTYWPMLCIYNQYSTWENVTVQGKGASAALTYAGWSGGQAFGNVFINCRFGTNGSPTGVTYGMLVSTLCSRWYGDHTASEQFFDHCWFTGDVAIGLEGNQTANNRFVNCYAFSYGNRRGSVVWNTAPSQADFTDGFYCDTLSGVVFRTGWIMALNVEGIWIDQGFNHLIDAGPVNNVKMRFTGGKLNAWGKQPNLARLIEQESPSDIYASNINVQMNEAPYDMLVNSGQYNFTNLKFDSTNLNEIVVLREPSEQQTAQEWPRFFRSDGAPPKGRPRLGFSLTIPGQEVYTPAISQVVRLRINNARGTTQIPIEIPPQKVVIPSQSIVFNSLTGRQEVRRQDWWSELSLTP